MLSKRGVSADLFIWIFAVIAGALLFLFFIMLSQQHASTSTTVEDIEFLRTFDQQISALSATDELSKTITFPRPITIHLDCGNFFTERAQEQTSLFLFGPSTLSQQKYTLVGKPWSAPFYTDMFYYIIPEGSVIVLFYEPSAASFVTSLNFPSTMPLKTLPLSTYSPSTLKQQLSGYKQVTLVFLGQIPDTSLLLRSLQPLPVTLLQVNLQRSTFTYYPSEKEYSYLGDALLFGAFFNQDQYACLSQKAIDRLHQLALLYQQKVVLFQQKLGSGSVCQSLLSQGGTLLRTLTTTTDFAVLEITTASLATINEDLERNDCPTIY